MGDTPIAVLALATLYKETLMTSDKS